MFREMTSNRVCVVEAQSSAVWAHRLVIRGQHNSIVWNAEVASLFNVIPYIDKELVPDISLLAIVTEKELSLYNAFQPTVSRVHDRYVDPARNFCPSIESSVFECLRNPPT
jgi:hypothetical protein